MLFYKSFESIIQDMIDRIRSNTEITDFSAGSIARAMVEAFGGELSTFYKAVDLNLSQAYLSSAKGKFLDLIGAALGVIREEDETDENYRFRIGHRWEEAATGNETAVRLAVLSVPGVRDVRIRPFVLGSGSFACYPIPEPGVNPEDLIGPIETVLREQAGAYGSRFIVSLGVERNLDIEVELIFDSTTTPARRDILLNESESVLADYIASLGLGDPLVLTQVTSRIMNLSSEETHEIQDVRITRLLVDEAPVLIDNITPEWDERLVASSIIVRAA